MQVYKLLYMVKIILMENETNENKTKTKSMPTVPNSVHRPYVGARKMNSQEND